MGLGDLATTRKSPEPVGGFQNFLGTSIKLYITLKWEGRRRLIADEDAHQSQAADQRADGYQQ